MIFIVHVSLLLFPKRSDDNRRAAGAVVTIHHSDSIMKKQSLQEISGPAARHYSCRSVFIRGSK